MSAGGHTGLVLAGGRWAPAQVRRHCEKYIADDFHACVGDTTQLTGGGLDGLKQTIALWVIRSRFTDENWVSYRDPRIAAIVSGVPYAADFDLDSLRNPHTPLAIITAQKDVWLRPRFHSGPVLEVCTSCEHLFDFPNGSHGALLSPLPPNRSGTLATLIEDPPGFDPTQRDIAHQKVVAWFTRKLLP